MDFGCSIHSFAFQRIECGAVVNPTIPAGFGEVKARGGLHTHTQVLVDGGFRVKATYTNMAHTHTHTYRYIHTHTYTHAYTHTHTHKY